jgi:hypothetical protein
MIKLVIRLLDAEGALLGWQEHWARVKGDGCLRADGPVTIPVDTAGVPTTLSTHWTDLNVEVRVPFTAPVSVTPGDELRVFEPGAALIQAGTPPGHLPAVTVKRRIAVAVPVGGLGVVGGRGRV